MDAQLAILHMLIGNLDLGFVPLDTTNRSNYTFSKVFERITKVMGSHIMPQSAGSDMPEGARSENPVQNMGLKPSGYLEHFGQLFMTTGVPLEKTYIGHKGIPVLKNFLNCCGFSKPEVHNLINELLDGPHNSKRGVQEINLSELFSKLSDLEIPVEVKKKDPVLKCSAIPHLEVILHRLGMNAQHIKKVLSDGRSVDGDLNLKSVFKSLRRIVRQDTDQLHGVAPSDEPAEAIFTSLKMNEENEKVSGAVSLDRFVQLLERAILRLRKTHTPNNPNIEKIVRHLMGEIVVDSKKSDSKLKLQSLAAQKMVDSLLGTNDKKEGADPLENVSVSGKDTPIVSHQGEARHIAQKTIFDDISTGTEKFSRILKLGTHDQEHRSIWRGRQKINIFETATENRPLTGSVKPVPSAAIPSSRSLPLYVVDQVSSQVSRSIIQGKNNIRIRLKPPHLGTVKLKMDMKGNMLKLDIATESQGTKEILLSCIQELKQTLVEQGINLERTDIHVNYHAGESMKDNQKGYNGEGDRTRNRRGGSSPPVLNIGRKEGTEEPTILRTRVNNRLDLIA